MPARPIIPLAGSADFGAGQNEDEGGVSVGSLFRGVLPWCRGTAVGVSLICRRRAATLTLCGIAEFTSPSTPPIAYRTQTLSSTTNGVAGCSYNPGCITPGVNGGFGYKWSGTYKYSAVDCSITNTSIEQFFPSDGVSNCGISPTASVTSPMSVPFMPSNITTASQTLTPNVMTWTYPGTCSGANQEFNGNAIATLSDPDTDADAIARFQATTPFPAFAACGSPIPCCLCGWVQRTTGFTFGYSDAQFNIVATGLAANRLICGAADIFRAPISTGIYVPFETIFIAGQTDGGGNLSLVGDVPNAVGFLSYATNLRYFPPL